MGWDGSNGMGLDRMRLMGWDQWDGMRVMGLVWWDGVERGGFIMGCDGMRWDVSMIG